MDASSCGPLTFLDVPYKGCCTFDRNIMNTILLNDAEHAVTLKMFYLQSYKFFDNLSSDVIRRFFTASERVRDSLDTLFKIQPKRNALKESGGPRQGATDQFQLNLPSAENGAVRKRVNNDRWAKAVTDGIP
ncbi:hypothetical protein KIN20_009608 [Parelaphostrongylus tenuis]|uniref:Uncharacterized protein n=1 Tax=Parelaphostrongylus tenuis TaxID=148309 RepID=A0AAD5M9S6_PARTN|nr:hypothetical protein KIN20_009608 [Parelaphostrongylus tenuis]